MGDCLWILGEKSTIMEGDPAGTKALAEMCKQCASSKGRALKLNVLSCLKHDNIFVFSELLDVEVVKQMRDDAELAPLYEAIRLFAYGTLADYNANKDKFSFLKEHHIQKLKKLTLLTLARGKQMMDYDTLLQDLEIESVRELEDLIIECMYLGVLKGKIDQRNRRIDVHFSLGRDVEESEVQDLVEKLEQWVRQANVLSESLSAQIAGITEAHEKDRAHKQELEGFIEAVTMSLRDEADQETMNLMEGGAGGLLGSLMSGMGRRGANRKRTKPGKARDDMFDPRKRWACCIP